MKNRFVRWIIYFAVGIVIGVGVSYYQKQKKMDDGVTELTTEEVKDEGIEIPSREDDQAASDEQSTMETFVEDAQEARSALSETAQDIAEKAQEAGEEVVDTVQEAITPENMTEESSINEPTEELIEEETVIEEAPAEAENEAQPAPETAQELTPMPE